LVCLALTLAFSCVAPAAGAAEGPLVVVVSSRPETPFVRRLAAELSLFGYRVELAGREASETDLSELMARHRGAALIAVDQGGQTAEVIVGQPSGPGPFRHERERLDPRRQADTNAAVLAERFRARLTELGIAPWDGEQTAVPAEIHVAPSEPIRRLWLGAGLGASSGGLGLMPDLELELRAFVLPWLSASVLGRLSPVPARVSGPEGSADVRLLAGGVLVDAYPFGAERSDLRFKLGAGAMLVNASVAGIASPPFRGRDDSLLVPAGLFESGAAWRLSPRVSFELRAFLGVCAPRVAVRLAGRRAADFGRPFVGVTVGAAIGVF
jgi:hypothetical protein